MWGADSNTVTVATIVNNVNTNRQNLQKGKKGEYELLEKINFCGKSLCVDEV